MTKISDLLIETKEIKAVVVEPWNFHNANHRDGWIWMEIYTVMKVYLIQIG